MADNHFRRRDFLRTRAGMLLASAAGSANTLTNGSGPGTSLTGSAEQADVTMGDTGEPTTGGSGTTLDGKWKLFYIPQGKYHVTQPDQLKTLRVNPIEATVLGNTQLDLSRQGELP